MESESRKKCFFFFPALQNDNVTRLSDAAPRIINQHARGSFARSCLRTHENINTVVRFICNYLPSIKYLNIGGTIRQLITNKYLNYKTY